MLDIQQLENLKIRVKILVMRIHQNPAYQYIESCYGPENTSMQLSRQFAEQIGLGSISVSQTEAHLMSFLAAMIRPQKIVEIGTLTGLSCQYFLQSLHGDGSVYTLEKSKEHVELSQQVLKPWIDQGRCHIIEGDARENLAKLQGPFDVIFIDGNKAAYGDYWNWAKTNIRVGGIILIDNVFLSGAVWSKPGEATTTGQKFSPKQVGVMKEMTRQVLEDAAFKSTFIPTEEGLLLAFKI